MPENDLYSIGEVAALLGVSTHTIRAWERRHGILSPARTQTHHRRYRDEDVELLRDVKRAIDLNGFSLRVAFQAVSGVVEPARAPEGMVRTPRLMPAISAPGEAEIWRTVADVLPELILIVDDQGNIVETNVAVARAIGGVRQRIKGRKLIELVDPFDREKASLLYRPRLRNARSWELNITTASGARLYSFQTSTLRQGERGLLVMVGFEMFDDRMPLREIETSANLASVRVPVQPSPGGTAVISRLQELLDKLPFGVAVTTIGPSPRIVYANFQLSQTLHLRSRSLLGQRLDEVLSGEPVIRALHESVQSRRSAVLRDVQLLAGRTSAARGRYFNVAVRPMYSPNRKVTGALVVVEDQTAEMEARARIAKVVADERLDGARTVDQLANLGVRHLAKMLADAEFIVCIGSSQSISSGTASLHVSPGWDADATEPQRGPVFRLLERVAESREPEETIVRQGGVRYRVGARAIVARSLTGRSHALGVVAWRRPWNQLPAPHERAAIDSFLVQFATAVELLQVRAVMSKGRERAGAQDGGQPSNVSAPA